VDHLVRVLRVLIAAEVSLVVVGGVAGINLRDSLPEMLQQYLALEYDSTWTALRSTKLAFYLVAFGLLVAGWIGLWKLKPWARCAYTTAWVLSVLIESMIGPSVMHAIAYTLSDLATLTAGMTLALIWFSPLAMHFGRKLPDPSPQDGSGAGGRPLG
jgi:hypothetical protein